MSRHAIDVTGERYGLLVAVKRTLKADNGKIRWVFKCDCGGFITTILTGVRAGKVNSCGCLRTKANTKHGQSTSGKTFTYRSWSMMKDRCTNPNNPRYHRYGGRGIKYCARWEQFENFFADMGERPPNLSLERVDNNGNYEPSNCKWATSVEQSNNRHDSRRYKSPTEREIVLANL